MSGDSLCALACGVVVLAILWVLGVCAVAWKGGQR